MQAGLVEKTVDERDRRARVLRLTQAGNQKVADFMPVHNRALEQIFGDLGLQSKRETIRTLNQLRKKLPQPKKDAT
jgi:DNA-binding MarR family transcriptional regulator